MIGVLLLACAVGGAGRAAAAPPPGAAPMIGDFAYDPRFHDATPGSPIADADPLPIERSADLDWMVHDSRTGIVDTRAGSLAGRIGGSAPFRLARRLGADEVIVPVWTLHL